MVVRFDVPFPIQHIDQSIWTRFVSRLVMLGQEEDDTVESACELSEDQDWPHQEPKVAPKAIQGFVAQEFWAG